MYVIHKTHLCVLDIAYNGTGSKWTTASLGWIRYMDEAGFNLTKRRKLGWNIIGHRATVDVPGQQGGNITMGCYLWEWCANAYSHYWAIKYRASCHLSRHSLQGSYPWTREGSDWRWLPKICDSLGQCQFPSLKHHQAMVWDPQQDADGVHLTLLIP